MTTLTLSIVPHSYEGARKAIIVSERDVPFATTYNVISPKTGRGMVFEFTHSTGSEWDAHTRWVYKSEDGLLLEVCNDARMVKLAADAYLKAKLRK